jgi:hypothetical protein
VHILVKTYLFIMGICSLCEVNARCFPCDACKKSFCKECADLTETEVRAIELKNRRMRFFCKNCVLIPKLSDMISPLQGQVNQLMLNQQKASPSVNEESIINELQDRQNRSKNVIVYNVPESRSSVINQRIVHDNDQIANVINDLGVSVNVCKVIRLGKSTDKSKPRPIKLICKDSAEALDMLRNKKKCKSDIKIRNDLTKMQRDYMTKILKELSDRKSKGEVNLSLKYDLIKKN